MTQTENTTRATILATFEDNTLSEIADIAQRFLSGGKDRRVEMDGDRRALMGIYGPSDGPTLGTDGSSGTVREVSA